MKKRNMIHNFLMCAFISGMFLLTGCAEDDDSSSSSGHDEVAVTLLDDMTVKIHWDKNYVGYSEVLSRVSGETARTGLVMTSNSTGSYEYTCSVFSVSSQVDFDCINTGNGFLSDNNQLTRMNINTEYDIQASEGLDHDYQSVAATLYYNSTAQKLELK